jgi:hypothetical protein
MRCIVTTITLPPELENRLAAEARKRGTTTERLALDSLQRLFIAAVDPPVSAVQDAAVPVADQDDHDGEDRPWRGVCAVEVPRRDEVPLSLTAESPLPPQQPFDILWDPHPHDD